MVTYPEDWKEVQIGDIYQIKRGQVLATNKISSIKNNTNKYPVYSSQTLNNGLLGYYHKFLFANGITWTTDGANAGTTKYREGRFYCTNVCGVLSSQEGFANACMAEIINKETPKYVSYVGNPKLMSNVVSKISIILPPLPEQQAIASALSDFDEHINNLSDLIEKKKAIRDGALEDLVSGRTKLDGFNGEWVEMTLEDICVPNGLVRGPFGGSLKKEMFVSKGNKVYEQRNAIYKSVRIGDYYISNGKYNELSRFAVKADDFIVSCSGTIGKIFKIPKQYKRGIINQALLKISIDQTKCNLNYFYKYFEWDKFQDSIIDNTQGGAMKNLVGMDIFRKTVILMPRDITEQKAIAQIISAMDEEIESLKIEKEKMIQIKEGAMDDLLTGRVRLKV